MAKFSYAQDGTDAIGMALKLSKIATGRYKTITMEEMNTALNILDEAISDVESGC